MHKNQAIQDFAETLGETPVVVEAWTMIKSSPYVALFDEERTSSNWLGKNACPVFTFPEHDAVAVPLSCDAEDVRANSAKFLKALNAHAAKKYASSTFYFFRIDYSSYPLRSSPSYYKTSLSELQEKVQSKALAKRQAKESVVAEGAPGSEFNSVLDLYSATQRKALVDDILPAISRAVSEGGWDRATSRRVFSALGKFGGELLKALKEAPEYHSFGAAVPYEVRSLWADVTNVRWSLGGFEASQEAIRELKALDISDEQREVLNVIEKYLRELAPLMKKIDRLAERAPMPVKVGDVIPAVAKTMHMHKIDPATVQYPPFEYIRKNVRLNDGRLVEREFVRILWPAGTERVFLSKNSPTNSQCDACAHAIKDPFNWVPILAYGENGQPYSMWVGNDCASKMFGIKVATESTTLYANAGKNIPTGAEGESKVVDISEIAD